MGTIERRKREADDRRRQIMSAGRKLFWKQGFERTTMPQIAAAAELAAGTLYRYFPSKDALYVELLAEGYAMLYDRMHAAAEAGGDPRAKARRLLDAFFDFAGKSPEYFDVLFFLLQQERSGGWENRFPAEQIRRLYEWRDKCMAVAARVLAAAKPKGNSDRERAIVIDAVWSMLAGVVFHFGLAENFPAVAAQARWIVLDAIFGSK